MYRGLCFLIVCSLAFLGSCVGDVFRNKNDETIREIERYDETGEPLQVGELVDERPVKVEYRIPGTTQLIIKEQKRTGWGLVPPPLKVKAPPVLPRAEVIELNK